MRWSKQLKEYSEKFWQDRRRYLGEQGEKADRVLALCSPDEKILLQYILATLPLSDLGDYGPGFFLQFVKNALQVREEFSWCAALPEHIFLLDVAYPRINTEELADCRGLFYNALADRVRGLSLKEAILEVNRWCAEEAAYRSTDLCTASPLTVYKCGYGRCGEESTFAVNALRSVGIAARQLYAPWWSHCDDNHAWVEAFDGRNWRYLGACEPEPELDRGWFTSAASRAVMIHTRAFVQGEKKDFDFLFPNTAPADLYAAQGVAWEAVTERYATTRPVTVALRNERGTPVSGAEVHFSVLNMAGSHEIAVRKTGQDGSVLINLGLGSVFVSAFQGRRCAEALLNAAECGRLEMALGGGAASRREGQWRDFEFLAPVGASCYPQPLSTEQKQLRRTVLDSAAAKRERKALRSSSLQEEALPPLESRIWKTLTEKDRAGGLRKEVLEDSRPVMAFESQYLLEIFEKYLLCPRIAREPLIPWRRELGRAFSGTEQARFRTDPRLLWKWLEKAVAEIDVYSALNASPAGIFRLKAGNAESRRLLFCALCRSLGIPARISPLDGRPEYYQDGVFHAAVKKAAGGELILCAPESQAGLHGQNYSLSRREGEQDMILDIGDIPAGESSRFSLESGEYRLLTVTRLPNGNQLARQMNFSIVSGETKKIELSFREGKAADMLEYRALPPFTLRKGEEERSSDSVLEEAPVSLLLWLEVGREPTEHILNELAELAPAFGASGCAVHLVVEEREQGEAPTLRKVLRLLPKAQVWYGDFQDTAPALARGMFEDPEKLPLVLLIDCKGNGLYSSAGYNVGTGELLLRLLAELGK